MIIRSTVVLIGLLMGFSAFTATDYQSIAECQKDMDKYIQQAKNIPDDFKSLAYDGWFNKFKIAINNTHNVCDNEQCTVVYKCGGCGVLALDDSSHTLFNLVKPQLEMEISQLLSNQDSLKPFESDIKCLYKLNTPPASGKCTLVQ